MEARASDHAPDSIALFVQRVAPMKSQRYLRVWLRRGYRAVQSMIAGAALVLSFVGSLVANEFVSYCQEALGKVDSLLADCRRNVRPFTRVFLPGGKWPGIREEHQVWIASSDAHGHLGVGCTLDGQGNMRFLGIYFTFDIRSYALVANSKVAFVDFEGNVGVQSDDGRRFVFLAIHELMLSGERLRTTSGKCIMPVFDREKNSTLLQGGRRSLTVIPSDGEVVDVQSCIDIDRNSNKKECHVQQYYLFFGEQPMSSIHYISPFHDTMISGKKTLFVLKRHFDNICYGDNGRRSSAVEYSGFIKEVCILRPSQN